MPTDKLAHACLGILIAGGTLVLASPMWAFTATLVAAAGKELYDTRKHGKPDILDAAATLAGGLIVIGASQWPWPLLP